MADLKMEREREREKEEACWSFILGQVLAAPLSLKILSVQQQRDGFEDRKGLIEIVRTKERRNRKIM
jgi:hypothetical protein